MRRAIGFWLLATILLLSALPVLAQTPAPQQADKDYVIGPEDILDIQVWGNKDLNQVVFVRPDGRTSLPLVGEIGVAGKTVQQLQDHLTNVYEKTVKGAVVTVIVREIRSRPVYFIGGFGKPGVMQLTRAQAEAWSKHGVTANAIGPGFFATPLTAPVASDPVRWKAMADRTFIGRNGEFEDLRGAAIFLASRASDFVTGQTLFVDGGFSAG